MVLKAPGRRWHLQRCQCPPLCLVPWRFSGQLVPQDFWKTCLWFCSSQLVREWYCVSTLWKAVQWRKSDCLETTLQIDRGATVMLALSKIYPILLRPSPTMAPEDFGVVGVLAWIEWWETCREMECWKFRNPSTHLRFIFTKPRPKIVASLLLVPFHRSAAGFLLHLHWWAKAPIAFYYGAMNR